MCAPFHRFLSSRIVSRGSRLPLTFLRLTSVEPIEIHRRMLPQPSYLIFGRCENNTWYMWKFKRKLYKFSSILYHIKNSVTPRRSSWNFYENRNSSDIIVSLRTSIIILHATFQMLIRSVHFSQFLEFWRETCNLGWRYLSIDTKLHVI